MRLAVRDAFDGSCGPGALASGLRGAVGRVSTVPDADVQRLVDEAIVLNELPRTFTRATAAFDPWAKRTVASGEARRRPIMLGRGRCVLADLIEGSRQNLILQSQTFQTTWTASSASISPDATTAPDGTLTADTLVESSTTANHFVRQAITKAASALAYSASVYAKNAGRGYLTMVAYDTGGTNVAQVTLNIITGAIHIAASTGGASPFTAASASITPADGGWFRCVLMFTTNTDTGLFMDCRLCNGTVTNYAGDGVSGIHLWGAQLEQATFPSSYIATTTTAQTRNADSLAASLAGLIDTRTNLLTYSQAFDSWTNNGVTVSADATTAPDGTTTADLCTSDGAAGSRSRSQNVSLTATTYTYSIYLKANTATTCVLGIFQGSFLASTSRIESGPGSVSGSTFITVSGLSSTDWTRVSLTVTATATTHTIYVYPGGTGTHTNGCYCWGAQLSPTAAAIEYLPTAASAFTTPPAGLSVDHGTLLAVAIPYGWNAGLATAGSSLYGDAAYGKASAFIEVAVNGKVSAYRGESNVATNGASDTIAGRWTSGVQTVVGVTWDMTSLRLFMEGGLRTTTARTYLYEIVTSMQIGTQASGNPVNGWVAVLYIPRALTPAEHQEFAQAVRAAA